MFSASGYFDKKGFDNELPSLRNDKIDSAWIGVFAFQENINRSWKRKNIKSLFLKDCLDTDVAIYYHQKKVFEKKFFTVQKKKMIKENKFNLRICADNLKLKRCGIYRAR